jgi:CxxC motif-containing protein
VIKNLTCIECPLGCPLAIDVENCRVVGVTGNKCPKGEEYARAEIENPVRIVTSCVLAQGLEIKMVPVRTDGPVSKGRLMEVMEVIKKARLTRPVEAGDVIISDLFGLKVNVVSTRRVRAR